MITDITHNCKLTEIGAWPPAVCNKMWNCFAIEEGSFAKQEIMFFDKTDRAARLCLLVDDSRRGIGPSKSNPQICQMQVQ